MPPTAFNGIFGTCGHLLMDPRVADIHPGSGNSFNNELYFEATDGINGDELWKFDGANAPSMVADIRGEVAAVTL